MGAPFTGQEPEAGSSQVTNEGSTWRGLGGGGRGDLTPGDLARKSSGNHLLRCPDQNWKARLTADPPGGTVGVSVCFTPFFAFLKYFYS